MQMVFRRASAAVLAVLALVFVLPVPVAAAPATGVAPVTDAGLPAGFPAGLRQFVGGTPQFKAAVWSTACQPGGVSAGPNTDPRFGWRNEAGTAGGVDVGRYLEAVTPYLPLLAWWTKSEQDRISWWKQIYRLNLLGKYPGDAVVARKSPAIAMLPKWPAAVPGGTIQYHWGFCSAELAKWAEPANTYIGFTWSRQLDPVTRADARARHIPVEQVEKTPCDTDIDNGVWCSIAYYVDCTRAETKAETTACVGWNHSISNKIFEDHHWGPDHRNNWDKLKSFVIGLAAGSVGVAVGVADFFATLWQVIKKIADFIKNASTALDKFVNELKRNSVGLVTSVLQNYNQGSAWDPNQGGFLSRYALMAGLGMILAAFMFFGAIRRAVDSGRREESKDLWIRLLKTFVIIVWAPALFHLLATSATRATADIVSRWTGGEAGGAVHKLTGMSTVTDSIPGGAFMGFILFLFLFIGALGLWVGLMVQRYGVEVGATLTAFVAGAYVHPRWQRKVSKALWIVVGLMLAKPVTMIVLGAAFGVINDGLSFGGSPTEVLAGLTLATIGVVTTGLAPFAALRWAPILPTSPHSHDQHRGGGGLVSGAVLGAAGASLASRASQARRTPLPLSTMQSRTRAAAPPRVGAAGSGGSDKTTIRGQVNGSQSSSGPVDRSQRAAGHDRGARSSSRGSAVRAAARRAPTRMGRGVAGGAAASGALGVQAAQTGLVRGRALADQLTPDVDLPEEERPS